MDARLNRLRKQKDVQSVLKRGKRLSGRYFQLCALHTNAMNEVRVAVFVGARTARLAVQRNRMRRRSRESFRPSAGRIGGWDIIIFPYKTVYKATFADLVTELEKHVKTLQSSHFSP
jgi:ribonuclease P protein component